MSGQPETQHENETVEYLDLSSELGYNVVFQNCTINNLTIEQTGNPGSDPEGPPPGTGGG